MAVGDVKVIGSFVSPFVMRPRIALNLKGVSYEFLEEEYGSKSELLLKSNPVYKKVPVLLHGDKVICESMIIVEYIDSVWRSSDAAPLVSSDPYHRAMARFWAVFVDDKWFPSMIGSIKPSTAEAKKACADQLIEATQLLETAFEKCSKGKPFFAGDCIGYLDIAFGSYLAGLKATEKVADVNILDERKTPLLLRWAERFCTDEAVKPVMPEPDDLVEYWGLFNILNLAFLISIFIINMGFCCKLFSFLLSIIFILGVIALVIYLVVRPSEVHSYVETTSLTEFSLTNNTLGYNLAVDVSIRNPNKKVSIYYDRVEASASYDGFRFGFDDSLPDFHQGHKNTTIIHPTFTGQQTISDTDGSTLVSTYNKEKGEGSFNIDITVALKVRYKALSFKTNTYKPKIKCSLKIPAPTSSSSEFKRTKCHVDFF